jgi:hypothetical protein
MDRTEIIISFYNPNQIPYLMIMKVYYHEGFTIPYYGEIIYEEEKKQSTIIIS